MARGRSTAKWERVYIDGYDMSGYLFDAGERGAEHAEHESWCFSDPVTGVIPGQTTAVFGPLNGVFDNTPTSGIHVLADAAKGTRRYITHARGVGAVPAIGDDAFCAPMLQTAYKGTSGGGVVTCQLRFAYDATAGLNYHNFFGALLHPLGSESAVNNSNTNHDNGAATTGGGWLMYHIRSITGTGTVTISVDDSATGTSWLALSGATTGAIATASAPTAGLSNSGQLPRYGAT